MPSRIVREALLESDRWLGLAHPVERLAYVVLLLKADDLATLDASDGQLVRLWRDPCNVKGREDATRILGALTDADLVRPYQSDGKRYVFVPRFRQRFRAESIRRPPPPESLLRDELGVLENIRRIKARTEEMTDRRPAPAGNGLAPAPAVVVEDEVEDAAAVDARFARWWEVYPKKIGEKKARAAWARIAPDDALTDIIISAVRRAKGSEQWRREGGRFIPGPEKYLVEELWRDEVGPPTSAHASHAPAVLPEQGPRTEMPQYVRDLIRKPDPAAANNGGDVAVKESS